MYMLERGAQPDKFGSIPAAAWWALATLTTVGYGDVVPITPFGKLLGGVVMLLGVGMIALPVAIIATGFSQESSRHQFVVTWSMVARVPLFAGMDQSEVAEITKLLYTRSYLPGVPMVRTGDVGDAMFIIASGEALVDIGPGKPERGRFLWRDGAARAAAPQTRRRRQDEVPSLCAGQPGPGAPCPPPP
jgi:voltage-gated potassium channel